MCYASQARPWHLGHLWSLSVEEQFYLLWPFAMALFFRYRKQIGWGVLLVAPILRFLAFRHGWHEIDEYFPTVADNIAAGCLLAIYRPQMQHSVWLQRLTHPAYALLLALLTVASPQSLVRVRVQILAGGVVPLLIALTIFVAVERKDWFLNNWLIGWVGVLSYSLYLWQQPFLNRHDPQWWTSFPLNVALVVVAAVLSYNLIEKPFLSYRKRAALPEARARATATAV
jgi:peptidoglycan/LPS O-acetylase OafA/YrhL